MKDFKAWYQPTQNNGLQWIRFYSYKHYLPKWFDAPNFSVNNPLIFWEKFLINDNEHENTEVIKYFERIIEEGYKAVMFQRLFTPAGLMFVEMLQSNGVKVFTEIDDGLELPKSHYAYRDFEDSVMKDVCIEQLEKSDGIVVSTNFLKQEFSKYNNNIEVVRNTIDRGFIRLNHEKNTKLKMQNKKIKIVYACSSSHDGDIEAVYPYLLRIADEFKDTVEIMLLGGVNNFMDRHDAIVKKSLGVDILQYYDKLADEGFDIGIAPLVDNYFNYCKSNFRFIEYSALGVPTIANYIQDFKYCIDHDACIRADFARKDSWYNALKETIGMGKIKLNQMGDRVKSYSHLRFNSEKEAKKLKDFVLKTCNCMI